MIELALIFAQLTESVTVTGVLITTQGALTAAVVALYKQNQKCLDDRAEIWKAVSELKEKQ